MNTGVSQTTAIPTFIVPTAVFAQPRFPAQGMFFDSSSITYQHTASVNKTSPKHSERITSGEYSNNSIRVVPKGRRPKGMTGPQLSNHNSDAFPDRPMCRACGKFFMSRQQLNQHMLVHTDVRKYKCSYCERSFKQPSHLHQHHRIHTGEKPYKCPIQGCTRAFPQQSNLNHHLRNHDKPAPPPENTCTLCMRTYASETVLRSHIAKIHLCNPDTLLGSQALSKSIAKDKKPYLVEADDHVDDHEKRMKVTYSDNDTLDSKIYERTVTFPAKYIQTQIPYNSNLSHEKNFSDDTHGEKYSIPNFNYTTVKQEAESIQINQTTNANFVPNKSQNDGHCDNVNSEKESDFVERFQYHYEFASHGIDNGDHHKIISNVPGINGNYDYRLGVSSEHSQGDSNENSNSNSNPNNTDVLNQNSEHSPVDCSSNSGRSRKRKAFQPQRIVPNKHSNDLMTEPESR